MIVKSPLFFLAACNYCCFILQGSCIGLYFINRPEWLIVDHACSAYSFISVPLYDTLGLLHAILYIFIKILPIFAAADIIVDYCHWLKKKVYCRLLILFRSRCCQVHCKSCCSTSYILCASNLKYCEFDLDSNWLWLKKVVSVDIGCRASVWTSYIIIRQRM